MKKNQNSNKQLSLTFEQYIDMASDISQIQTTSTRSNVIEVDFPTKRNEKSFRERVIEDLIRNRVIYEG